MNPVNNGLENQHILLTSRALNPFIDWSDWYGTDGEAVVTFITMKEHFWNRWSNNCVSIVHEDCNPDEIADRANCEAGEHRVDPGQFDVEEIRAPGIYRDGIYYEDEESVDESYTIVVPYPFLSPTLCQQWIEELNEEYDRVFELKFTDEQAKRAGDSESMGNRVKLPEGDDSGGTT